MSSEPFDEKFTGLEVKKKTRPVNLEVFNINLDKTFYPLIIIIHLPNSSNLPRIFHNFEFFFFKFTTPSF